MNDSTADAVRNVFVHSSTIQRRHGPKGYTDDQSFKPWLRDEFSYRCIYCLWRERWEGDGHHSFGVEHVRPKSQQSGDSGYDGLVYACNTCNSTRRDVELPVDVATELLNGHLECQADGTMRGLTTDGIDLIDLCRLNRPVLVEARSRILKLLAFFQSCNDPLASDALHDLMSFPTELPDLRSLRPPGGNDRPEGVESSYHELRIRGELPDVY